MTNGKRLNPFVYISETDIAFYLMVLIGIIIPSFYAIMAGIVIYYGMGQAITPIFRLLIAILIFSFIPSLIYWKYRRFPRKIINESKLKEFDEKRFQEQHGLIESLYSKYLPVARPKLMYNPLDPSESAFTFGTKNQIYVGMYGGFVGKKFRNSIDGFRAIFLHEMGHIVNGDVGKTFLAASTWRIIFLILSLLLAFSLLYLIYPILLAFSYGIYDTSMFISSLRSGAIVIGIGIYFLLFLGITYVLRNKIIRMREFYADARVIEWDESPSKIVKTLEESGVKEFSKFEILKKFHPNLNERIQVLKNNESLFISGLWVAFSIGFFFGLIELTLTFLNLIFSLSSSEWTDVAKGNYQSSEIYLIFRTIASFFIVPILMLAVSSSLHKSALKDIFIMKKKYFSNATVLNLIKFSLVLSLGWLTEYLMQFFQNFTLYDINTMMRDFSNLAVPWLTHAFIFLIVLLYLQVFASILIRRSFSKKDATKNFITITILSSFLYIVGRYYAIETLHNKSLVVVFFLVFSILTFAFIKVNDRKLLCPACGKNIDFSNIQLNCPTCHQDLYQWAVYPFSKNQS